MLCRAKREGLVADMEGELRPVCVGEIIAQVHGQLLDAHRIFPGHHAPNSVSRREKSAEHIVCGVGEGAGDGRVVGIPVHRVGTAGACPDIHGVRPDLTPARKVGRVAALVPDRVCRRIRVAGAGLVAVPVVCEAHPDLDLLARIGSDHRVGA